MAAETPQEVVAPETLILSLARADNPPVIARLINRAAIDRNLILGLFNMRPGGATRQDRFEALKLFRWACGLGELTSARGLDQSHAFTRVELTYAPKYANGAFEGKARPMGAVALACANGRQNVLEWLAPRFGLTRDTIMERDAEGFVWACAAGQLGTAQWLADQVRLEQADIAADNYAAFRLSCANGRLEVAQWLADRFGLGHDEAVADSNSAFVEACASPRARELAGWLVQRFGLSIPDVNAQKFQAFVNSCGTGDLELAQWLFQSYAATAGGRPNPLPELALRGMAEAARRGDLAMDRWLVLDVHKGRLTTAQLYEICNAGLAEGRVELPAFFFAQARPDEVLLNPGILAAVSRGHQAVFDWALARNLLPSPSKLAPAFLEACKAGKADFVRHLIASVPESLPPMTNALVEAAKSGDVALLGVVWDELRPRATPEDLFNAVAVAFDAAVLNDHLEAAQFLRETNVLPRSLPANVRLAVAVLADHGDVIFLEWLDPAEGLWRVVLSAFQEAEESLGLTAEVEETALYSLLSAATIAGQVDVLAWAADLFSGAQASQAGALLDEALGSFQTLASDYWLEAELAWVGGTRARPANYEKWVADRHSKAADEAFVNACRQGAIEFARWAQQRFGVIEGDPVLGRAFAGACSGGHVAVVKFLLKTFPGLAANGPFHSTCLVNAFRNNRLGFSKWVVDTFKLLGKFDPATITENDLKFALPQISEWYRKAFNLKR